MKKICIALLTVALIFSFALSAHAELKSEYTYGSGLRFYDGATSIFYIYPSTSGLLLTDNIPFSFGNDADFTIKSDGSSGVLTGNVEVTGTFAITGAVTLIDDLSVGGDADVTGTLAVTGATTLRSTADITGILTTTTHANIGGNANVTGTLAATGATTLRSTLDVTGVMTAGSIQNTPIGATTASTGAFTALDATGTVTISSASVTITATAISLAGDDWQDDEIANDLTIDTTNSATFVSTTFVISSPTVTITATAISLAGDDWQDEEVADDLTINTTKNMAVNSTTIDLSATTVTVTGAIGLIGDLTVSGHVDGTVFFVNAFQYPAPSTDWTPQLEGAGLPDARTAKVVWIPLNFLKAGDEIVRYTLVGDVVEASIATVDAQIYRIDLADPLTTTAITGGAMTQVVADGNFDVLTTLTDPEVVATDKQYVIQITGTTTASDAITVMGAEVAINRKP